MYKIFAQIASIFADFIGVDKCCFSLQGKFIQIYYTFAIFYD